MGFFSRLFGSTRQRTEDEIFLETVDKSIQDMRQDLQRVNRAAADALNHHNRLEAEFEKAMRQADEWKQRAKEALQGGDESLARTALTKSSERERIANEMRDTVESSRNTVNQLTQQVQSLKRKIHDAERHARTLVARKSAARAQQRIADAMIGLGGNDDAFTAISEYEERVLVQEAQGKVFDTPSHSTGTSEPTRKTESESAQIDADLEALKRELRNQ